MTTETTETTAPGPARVRWHELTVASVQPLTEDAVAVTFDVPDDLAAEFAFAAGQHLTLRHDLGGLDVRRSYSICVTPAWARDHRQLRVGVKHLGGGAFSTWVLEELRPGDRLQVMAPQGHFTCSAQPGAGRHHVAVAAGSGITPVLSLLTDALEQEPDSRATLLYGNRRTSSIMFLEELEDLKNRFPARFHLIHVLSREAQDVELFSGRLEPERIGRILDLMLPVDTVDEWYLCGPFEMVTGARELLSERGVESGHVHLELFHVGDEPPPARSEEDRAADTVAATVTVNLDGRTTRFEMSSRAETILNATLRARPDAPYACTGGVCGTCRARLVTGEVRMDRNYALEPEELARGLVLACQSHPVTDEVELDYDA
ncbi:MAG: 1,2-phenylacetyl-CoA epoxidase subunit PaaE [Actinomycetales bacterium]